MFDGKTHYFDWAIFNSYVSLPEGTQMTEFPNSSKTNCEDLTRPRTFHTERLDKYLFGVHRSTPQDIQANTSVAEAGKFSQDFLSRK